MFQYPNQLLIWAHPENLVEIRHLVEAVDELCGTGGQDRGQLDSIDNLSQSLWLLAWLGSALAEVCQ